MKTAKTIPRQILSERNMIDFTSLFIYFILEDSIESECDFPRGNITRIECVLEIGVSCILFCPINECHICLCGVSFSMFIFPYPESEIHPMFFGTPESDSAYESVASFFENKVLKNLSLLHRKNTLFYKIQFLFIRREKWTH